MTSYFIKKFVGDKYDPNNLEVRRRFGMLSGIIGIICNLTLSAGKLFVGLITSSIAVSADAFNNLADAASSIVTLICFRTSNSPANKDHPFGYGRVEYISGLIVSMAIIFTGIEFTKSSVEKIFDPEPVSSGIIPIIILSGSLLVKIWMGLFNRKIGKIIRSTAMKATAFDSLLDAIITVTILLGLGITYFTGVSIDAYLGIVVALFIIFTGLSMIKETVDPLIGQSPTPEFVKEINDIVFSSRDVVGIHELIVHNYGPGRSVISLHAEMPATKNIMELHESVDTIEKKLKDKFGCQAIIHIDPIETDDEVVNNMRDKLSKLIKLVHKDAKIYDLRIVPGSASTLIFHVSVPYDIKQTNQEIINAVTLSVKAIDSMYECIIDVDRNYFNPQPSEDITQDTKD